MNIPPQIIYLFFKLYVKSQKYLRKPGQRFYAAFIDFRRAFDMVDRNTLCVVEEGNTWQDVQNTRRHVQ